MGRIENTQRTANLASLGLAAFLIGALGGCSSTRHRHVTVHTPVVNVIQEQAPVEPIADAPLEVEPLDFPTPAMQADASEPVRAPESEPAGETEPVEPRGSIVGEEPEAAPEPIPETIAVIVGSGRFHDPVFAPRVEQLLLERGMRLAEPEEATRTVHIEVGVRKVMDLGAERALVDGEARIHFEDAAGVVLDRAILREASGANGSEPMARDEVLDDLAEAIVARIDAALARPHEQDADLAQSGTGSAKNVLKVDDESVKKDA